MAEKRVVVKEASSEQELFNIFKDRLKEAPIDWMVDNVAHLMVGYMLVKSRTAGVGLLMELMENAFTAAGFENPVLIDLAANVKDGEKPN